MKRIDPITLGRAKELRQRQTLAEKLLWKELRAKRFHEYKFRRQVPIGPFIVDFLCFEHRLVVELDGDFHWEDDAVEYDRRRTAYLRSCGFTVIRFGNRAIIQSMNLVLERIRGHLEKPSP